MTTASSCPPSAPQLAAPNADAFGATLLPPQLLRPREAPFRAPFAAIDEFHMLRHSKEAMDSLSSLFASTRGRKPLAIVSQSLRDFLP